MWGMPKFMGHKLVAVAVSNGNGSDSKVTVRVWPYIRVRGYKNLFISSWDYPAPKTTFLLSLSNCLTISPFVPPELRTHLVLAWYTGFSVIGVSLPGDQMITESACDVILLLNISLQLPTQLAIEFSNATTATRRLWYISKLLCLNQGKRM